MLHDKNLRVWFDLEPILAGRDVDLVDGKWKLRREVMRQRVALLAWQGVNGMRILPYGGWNPNGTMQKAEECFTPYLVENGKFNLDRPNPDYWPIIYDVAWIMAEFNVEMWFCLFDNCQFWHNPAWACWRNNIQGRGNYMEDLERSEAWTLEAVNNLGHLPNVGWVVCNEADDFGNPKRADNWYTTILTALKDCGVKPEHISLGAILNKATGYENGEFIRKRCLQDAAKSVSHEVFGEPAAYERYLPVHSVTDDPSAQWLYGILHAEAMAYFKHLNCILSNDGCKDKDSTKNRVLWREMCAATIPQITSKRKIIFEFLSDSDSIETKIASAQYMAEGIGKSWLVNWHRKPYVPEPEPAPGPQPEPEPTPPQTCTLWYHLKRLNFHAAWDHLMGRHK